MVSPSLDPSPAAKDLRQRGDVVPVLTLGTVAWRSEAKTGRPGDLQGTKVGKTMAAS